MDKNNMWLGIFFDRIAMRLPGYFIFSRHY